MLNVSKYLCIVIPFSLRKAFARFRCSSYKFSTELGRHRGIDRADRVCLSCFNNNNFLVVEDEYHVFFKCEKFNALRNEYLNTWCQSGDSLQNFHNIISTKNPVLIKKMCIYINELLKLKDNEN